MNSITLIPTDYSSHRLVDIEIFRAHLDNHEDLRTIIQPKSTPINEPAKNIFANSQNDKDFFSSTLRSIETWNTEYHHEINLLTINNSAVYFDSFASGCNFTGKVVNEGVLIPPESITIRPSRGGLVRQLILNNAAVARDYTVSQRDSIDNKNIMKVSFDRAFTLPATTCLLMPYERTFPWTELTDQYLKLCTLKEYLGNVKFEEITFIVHADTKETYIRNFYRLGVKKLVKVPPRSLVLSPMSFVIPEINIHYGYPSPLFRGILRKNFLSTFNPSQARSGRLFVPRDPPNNGRNILNSNSLKEYFDSIGFTIVNFECLDIFQQAELFAQANTIVLATGSAAANLVFSSASVLELSPKSYSADEVRFYSGCEGFNSHNILLSDYDVVNYSGFSSSVESMYFSIPRIRDALNEIGSV